MEQFFNMQNMPADVCPDGQNNNTKLNLSQF
jgi:hypothetical protein